jgi:hypothetical protein
MTTEGGQERVKGEQIGRALAYAMGDLRDWPKQCAWCGSERLLEDHERQILHCEECARQTSNEVAYQFRRDRARAEVTGQPRVFREVDP